MKTVCVHSFLILPLHPKGRLYAFVFSVLLPSMNRKSEVADVTQQGAAEKSGLSGYSIQPYDFNPAFIIIRLCTPLLPEQ